jgi:hypothetical protein
MSRGPLNTNLLAGITIRNFPGFNWGWCSVNVVAAEVGASNICELFQRYGVLSREVFAITIFWEDYPWWDIPEKTEPRIGSASRVLWHSIIASRGKSFMCVSAFLNEVRVYRIGYKRLWVPAGWAKAAIASHRSGFWSVRLEHDGRLEPSTDSGTRAQPLDADDPRIPDGQL